MGGLQHRVLSLAATIQRITNEWKSIDKNDFSKVLPDDFSWVGVAKKSYVKNSWFDYDSLNYCFQHWFSSLTKENLLSWLNMYEPITKSKRVGLILAGNIPMVGLHDVLCVLLSGHEAVIKTSSKDADLIPFLLKEWKAIDPSIQYEIVDKLDRFDAVIATGSNSSAEIFERYFAEYPKIIRKNRTSVAILSGDESDEELQKLSEDVLRYFGLGCRNVTQVFVPEGFDIDKLYRNFTTFEHYRFHHSYMNNHNYHKAIFLLNHDTFWDNDWLIIKLSEDWFCPPAMLNVSFYHSLDDVANKIKNRMSDTQAIVGKIENFEQALIPFGEAQKPSLTDYADNVDTMDFLSKI